MRLPGGASFSQTFSSLRHRNYRLLWLGTMVSHSGDWMDQIAFNWLVLMLSDSPLSLGLVNLFRAVPIFFLTPLGGVAADRWERRKILIITQSLSMFLAFLIGLLVTTGRVRLWETFLIAALRGALMSFNAPARQSLISDLVPRQDLANAVALNYATNNLTRILGPSAGGVLIALFGVDWLFYLNAFSFLAVIWTLYLMTEINTANGAATAGSWENLKEGLTYLRKDRLILYLVLLALVPMFFGQPYMTMLTVFARDILQVGPAGLGLLTSVTALGSMLGALAVAGQRRPPQVMYMLGGLIFFGLSLLLFSFSRWLLPSLLFLFLAGYANLIYNSINNSLIQLTVSDQYRGRVLSLLFLNRGLVPLGTAFTGWLAEMLGTPLASGLMSIALVLLGGLAFFFRPAASQAAVSPDPQAQRNHRAL